MRSPTKPKQQWYTVPAVKRIRISCQQCAPRARCAHHVVTSWPASYCFRSIGSRSTSYARLSSCPGRRQSPEIRFGYAGTHELDMQAHAAPSASLLSVLQAQAEVGRRQGLVTGGVHLSSSLAEGGWAAGRHEMTRRMSCGPAAHVPTWKRWWAAPRSCSARPSRRSGCHRLAASRYARLISESDRLRPLPPASAFSPSSS